jgi:hypothetical protein
MKNSNILSTYPYSNPCDLWTFEAAKQAWLFDFQAGFTTTCLGNPVTFSGTDVITGGDEQMNIGKGYFFPGNSSPEVIFEGRINNGDITTPILTTTLGNNPHWDNDDWNLVGNPYPSGLDAQQFWIENAINNSRITDAIYFWDDNGNGSGYNQHADYASWNMLGGVNSGNSSRIPDGSIASGQGFWVVANQNTDLVFNNSMRTVSNEQFFKKELTNNATEEKTLAWFSVNSPRGFQNNILVGYSNNATDEMDALYDAHKLEGNASHRFASLIDGEEFSIQGFSTLNFGEEKVIPLFLFTDTSGEHTFSQYKTENLPVNVIIYLKDYKTGELIDLSKENYTVTLDGGLDYDNRFVLIFKHNVTNNDDEVDKSPITGIDDLNESPYKLTQNKESFIISNENGINGDLYLYDITGRMVYQKQNIHNTTSVHIDWSHVHSGSYIISIIHNEKRAFAQQIIKP